MKQRRTEMFPSARPARHSARMRGIWHIAGLLCLLLSSAAVAELSDEEVRKALIQQSIAAYRGNCPCPYNIDRAGRQCGRRSAYSKQGGDSPLCYSADVTAEMIARYRNL